MRTAQPPARLASEDVIINAPMSYAGSAQRIIRLRRRADGGAKLVAVTLLAILLILMVFAVTLVEIAKRVEARLLRWRPSAALAG